MLLKVMQTTLNWTSRRSPQIRYCQLTFLADQSGYLKTIKLTANSVLQLVSPRKSPKKSKEQTAGSPRSKQARERLRKHPGKPPCSGKCLPNKPKLGKVEPSTD